MVVVLAGSCDNESITRMHNPIRHTPHPPSWIRLRIIFLENTKKKHFSLSFIIFRCCLFVCWNPSRALCNRRNRVWLLFRSKLFTTISCNTYSAVVHDERLGIVYIIPDRFRESRYTYTHGARSYSSLLISRVQHQEPGSRRGESRSNTYNISPSPTCTSVCNGVRKRGMRSDFIVMTSWRTGACVFQLLHSYRCML